MSDSLRETPAIDLPLDSFLHELSAKDRRDHLRWWAVAIAVLLHIAVLVSLIWDWDQAPNIVAEPQPIPVQIVVAPPPQPAPQLQAPPPPAPAPKPDFKPRQSGADEKSTTVAAANEQAPEAATPPPNVPTSPEKPVVAPPLPEEKPLQPQETAKGKPNKQTARLETKKEAETARAPKLGQQLHSEFELGDREQVGDPYLNNLRTLIEQHRIFPHLVGQFGLPLEGVAVYRIAIDRAGNLRNMQIEHSSGVPALDQVGEQIVRNASPFPPLPGDYPGAVVFVTLTMPLYSEHR